ncbi:hypothetical protein B0T14DRAFT_88933 [Immersiella caudata]|uniref:DUF676 domain-containing protein n=1 Tax=Immersiella caudata TaxID=314043 RepID=A0AA39X2S6_9PEZI|nr:hypothetical protein B0T14DRAFT_88933 [Immersiella caudata]
MVQNPNTPAHHPSAQPGRSLPPYQTWRVRGVPTNFNRAKLVEVLHEHPDLNAQAPASEDRSTVNNGAWVCTLASDIEHHQVATVRFKHLPARLDTLALSEELIIDIDLSALRPTRLAIDQHFHGVTVLFCPVSNHSLDILAVPGLNSHPFGSFVHKGNGNMWLSDDLPRDMPNARVMIYGYDSKLEDSTNFAGIDDIASSLRIDIGRIISRSVGQKRLILIGHSLGGLLVKGALIRMAEAQFNRITQIIGALFFGVPNRGMDGIESLIAMVTNQPNGSIVESLSMVNSNVLLRQEERFPNVIGRMALEMFCFYETLMSPTAARDSDGKWKMIGPRKVLVNVSSAIGCLPQSKISTHSAPLSRTHSDLVKFTVYDPDYNKVCEVLRRMQEQASAGASRAIQGPSSPSNDADQGLIKAARNGDVQKAIQMLDNGAKLETEDPDNLRSPLDLAVVAGHQQMVELLLQRGSDVKTKDKWRETPLRHAILEGHVDIAKLLIRYGADIHAKDSWNQTPLWLVQERRYDIPQRVRQEILELILQHAAS